MEAIYRASEESAPAGNSRFVPITVPRSRGLFVARDGVDFRLMLRKWHTEAKTGVLNGGRFNEKGSARKFPICPTQPEGRTCGSPSS
jgi:hypothetical protein